MAEYVYELWCYIEWGGNPNYKKSSANKVAKSHDSSKSQALKTGPQPKRTFC